MVQTKKGFAPKRGLVEDCLDDLRRRAVIAPHFEVLVADPLIDSARAGPVDWNWIGSTIAAHYDGFDGFVVIHGTDTLAFTASALSFALEGLDKPVVITGAMVPLSVEGSDGAGNLTDAMQAVHHASAGVWVQMAGQLMLGARVQKIQASGLDAFAAKPGGVAPVQDGPRAFAFRPFGAFDVPVVTFTPGMSGDVLAYVAARADGLILRCYGSGSSPMLPELAPALAQAKARGVPVVALTQCAGGAVAFETYETGDVFLQAGVLNGKDATVEAIYAKVLYALEQGGGPEAVAACLMRNIAGEFAQ